MNACLLTQGAVALSSWERKFEWCFAGRLRSQIAAWLPQEGWLTSDKSRLCSLGALAAVMTAASARVTSEAEPMPALAVLLRLLIPFVSIQLWIAACRWV